MLDGAGHVAELAASNIWMAKDGVVATPADNGTFLNEITRQRVLQLLQADGVTVQERTLTRADLEQADEIFSNGNYGKVVHVKRVEDRDLPYDALARRAHRLYIDYTESTRQA